MVLSDPQENRERRVTVVCPAPQDNMAPRETMVSPVLQVPSVPSAPLDYLVHLVLKELKGRLVKLDRRERPVHLDLLANLAPPAMSSTPSP